MYYPLVDLSYGSAHATKCYSFHILRSLKDPSVFSAFDPVTEVFILLFLSMR